MSGAVLSSNPSPASDDAPPADAAVVREWGRRVEAEYRSSAIAQGLTLWLTQLSAPPGLLHAGLQVASDEVVHAQLSLDVYQAAGGATVPELAADTLDSPRLGGSREADILHCTLRYFCLGETVAVRLFRRLREQCSVAVARTALDRVLVDEVRHRDFGWTTLEWLLSTRDGPGYRREAERMLPDLLAQQRSHYGGGRHAPRRDATFPEHRRAWGLMPSDEYLSTLLECHRKDYTRLFADLEIPIPPAPG